MGYTLCTFISYGAFFSWFTAGPILLINGAGISPIEFGWFTFYGGGISMMLAGFLNERLVTRFGSLTMLRLGWALMFIAGALLALLSLICGATALSIAPPVALFYFGSTFIGPNVFAATFTSFGKIAGYAGSLYSFMQLGGGFVLSALVAYLPDEIPFPLPFIFMICAASAWGIFEFFIPKENFPKPTS